MKTVTFIAITLLAGAAAGTILGIINQGIVEPFIERAINLENQQATKSGEIVNPIEFAAYRVWQRIGEVTAGTILGLSFGALFGIIFAYGHGSLPGSNYKKKALILAGIMWFVLFLAPALKYPANPPAVGNPETIYYRQSLYIAFVAISGTSALGLALLYRKISRARKIIIPAVYAAILAGAYLIMPPNPDSITAPMDLVIGFRVVSTFTMTVFWGLLGIIFGSLWDKLKPHETPKIKTL